MTQYLKNARKETDKETEGRIPMQCGVPKSFSASNNSKIQDMKL